MNLIEAATSNYDFAGNLQSAKDASDRAQDEYDKALQTNEEHFYQDCLNGRPGQIARVVGGHKLTLANELLDKIDSQVLFLLIQSAMRGEDVSDKACELVSAAAKTFAEAITEWTE